MALTHDELLLPVRTPTALREEVACRVARQRRRRARRRALRIAVPALAAVLAVIAGSDGMPTGVHTIDGRTGPASEGTVHSGTAGWSGSTAAPGRAAGADTESSPRPDDDPRPAGSSPASPSPAPRSSSGPGDSGRSAAVPNVRLAVARTDGIWELRSDGTPVRRLVAGSEPAWSPDGRRVAYTKRWEGLGGGVGVAVLDLDTMQSRYLLVGSEADYVDPAWSPDGRRIAASRQDRSVGAAPLQPSVVIVDAADGGDRVELGPGDGPSWLHDGRILYRCESRLCIRSADGATTDPVPGSGDLVSAAWSPDGTWIAAWEQTSQALVVLRPDGSGRRTVVDRATGPPAWTPDGARVVYPSAEGLRSVRIDGGDVRVVTDQPLDADPDLVGR